MNLDFYNIESYSLNIYAIQKSHTCIRLKMATI